MKEFVVVIQEEGPCRIELSPKGIDGLVCKKLPKIMLESVTNVRGMLRNLLTRRSLETPFQSLVICTMELRHS